MQWCGRGGEGYDMTADICHNPLRNTALPDSARQMTLSSEPTPLGFNQSISPHYRVLLSFSLQQLDTFTLRARHYYTVVRRKDSEKVSELLQNEQRKEKYRY